MDNLKEAGKILKKNVEESAQNTKRIAENIPLIERASDYVGVTQSYKKEFPLSNHKHQVHLNFNVKELQPPCNLNAIEELITAETMCGNPGAYYPASDPYGADGQEHPLFYDGFVTNIGGFSLPPEGGVIVPLSGIYTIRYNINFASVARPGFENIEWISVSIRRNGYILATAINYTTCGLCFFAPSFVLRADTYANAGDNIGGWAGAISGLPFYTPSNLCGIALINQRTTITLLAEQA